MKAAVIHSYAQPPVYDDFVTPIAQPGELLLKVHAAALSPLVKAQASGKHYSSTGVLPSVPGVDGVGELADGRRLYFAFPRAPFGAMAQLVPVPQEYVVDIPANVDDITAAAIANPAMSSWAALSDRAQFARGESVLINGATGASGQLAVKIARYFGAQSIVVTGRNPAILADLINSGADAAISLQQKPASLIHEFGDMIQKYNISVVLDYLWGGPTQALFSAIAELSHRSEPRRIRCVQIGNSAGGTLELPASVLRSSPLELFGSGIGSISQIRLVQIIGEVFRAIEQAKLQLSLLPTPLSDVGDTWQVATEARRVYTLLG
jgi:NADPH:quinone reductase-like Zn-dependent oxidoreductase